MVQVNHIKKFQAMLVFEIFLCGFGLFSEFDAI